MQNQNFIKIGKDTLIDDDYQGFKNLVMSYLFFKRDLNNQITISLTLMCQELGIPYHSPTIRNAKTILSIIQSLIDEDKLVFEPRLASSLSDLNGTTPFILTVTAPFTSYSNNFVMVSQPELYKFTQYLLYNSTNIRSTKLFSVFLIIKSYMNMNPNFTPYCNISLSKLGLLSGLRGASLKEALSILESAKLIYITHYASSNSMVHTLYTLTPCSDDDLANIINIH